MTAYRALTVAEDWPRRLHPGALDGATVLVAGGAGAVGHAAIQLAVWAGATVVTTVSGPEKADLATAAGAHHVVDYKAEDAVAAITAIAPHGVDIVVEVAPAQNAALNAAVASPRASIAIYANNGGDQVVLDVRPNMVANARYQFILLYTVGDQALRDAREDVTAAARAGALEVGDRAGPAAARLLTGRHGSGSRRGGERRHRQSADPHRRRPLAKTFGYTVSPPVAAGTSSQTIDSPVSGTPGSAPWHRATRNRRFDSEVGAQRRRSRPSATSCGSSSPPRSRRRSATAPARGKLRFPDDVVTAQRIMNERGVAVPNWPVEWGGQDRTPLQRQIWSDELRLACVPEPLAFNASMVGPRDRPLRLAGPQGTVPPEDREPRHLVVPGLLRTGGRLGPGVAADHRRARRGLLRRQRPEDVDHVGPVRGLDLPARPDQSKCAEAAGGHLLPARRNVHAGESLCAPSS